MEMSSLGICAREPLAPPYMSVLSSENLGNVLSGAHVVSRNFHPNLRLSRKWQDAGPSAWRCISNEQNSFDEHSSSGIVWGGESRAPSIFQHGQQNVRHMPHAVSTAPAARLPVETGSRQSWRLDDEIVDLKELMKRLKMASGLMEKTCVIDNNRRVRSLFGGFGHSGIYVNPLIDLAMRVLSPTELYLLKCMVASGQDHVLDIPPQSLAVFHDLHKHNGNEGKKNVGTHKLESRNPVKDALSMLANFIESCKDSSEDLSQLSPLQWMTPAKDPETMMTEPEHKPEGRGDESLIIANQFTKSLHTLVHMLERVERFYDSIGGVIGYTTSPLCNLQQSN